VSGKETDRNSLEEPTKLAPQAQPIVVHEPGTLRFTLPALSAGVLTLSAK
jgi:hypothetical protein